MQQSSIRLPQKYVAVEKSVKTADRKVKFVVYLFSEGPKEYDFLLKILSLGRDAYWRTTTIQKAGVSHGGRVLDIACGTGLLSYEFAKKGAHVVGIDVTREMLLRAKQLKEYRLYDVDLVHARAENLPLRSDKFDAATISLATRNVTSVESTLSEMKRCVKQGGHVLSMDFTRPTSRFFRPFYYFYIFNVLPTLGVVISRHWNGIFSYLANSIKRSKNPEEIASLMHKVGLNGPSIQRMTQGVTALVVARKLRLGNN